MFSIHISVSGVRGEETNLLICLSLTRWRNTRPRPHYKKHRRNSKSKISLDRQLNLDRKEFKANLLLKSVIVHKKIGLFYGTAT